MPFAQEINTALRRVPIWPLYVIGVLPIVWLFYLAFTGNLGVDPVKELEHSVGKIGLQLIVAGLVVTPLRKATGVSFLRFRRCIGVLAFVYVSVHLLVWIAFDLQFRWAEIGADIVKRPYITVGMTGFLLLLPLAVTSNNWSVRRLGAARWQKLHKLVYPAALAGAAHYLWLVKSWPPEPILYFLGVVGLLLLRVRFSRRRAAPGSARPSGSR